MCVNRKQTNIQYHVVSKCTITNEQTSLLDTLLFSLRAPHSGVIHTRTGARAGLVTSLGALRAFDIDIFLAVSVPPEIPP